MTTDLRIANASNVRIWNDDSESPSAWFAVYVADDGSTEECPLVADDLDGAQAEAEAIFGLAGVWTKHPDPTGGVVWKGK